MRIGVAAIAAGVMVAVATGCSSTATTPEASGSAEPSASASPPPKVTGRVVGKPDTEYGLSLVTVQLRNNTDIEQSVCALVAAVKGDVQVEQTRKCIPNVAAGRAARIEYGFDPSSLKGATIEIVEAHTQDDLVSGAVG